VLRDAAQCVLKLVILLGTFCYSENLVWNQKMESILEKRWSRTYAAPLSTASNSTFQLPLQRTISVSVRRMEGCSILDRRSAVCDIFQDFFCVRHGLAASA
jgi:hypothetical protein